MSQNRWTIDDPSRPAGRGEAVRAFVLFGALLVVLCAIAGRVALGDLSRIVLYQRLDLGRDEARQIAESVEQLAGSGEGLDFQRLEGRLGDLETAIRKRLLDKSFVRHVEVRDRFGARLLFLEGGEAGEARGSQEWPDSGEHVVAAPLLGRAREPGGEVVVGISDDASRRQLGAVRRSLLLKVAFAAI